jgi:hypothetical protein
VYGSEDVLRFNICILIHMELHGPCPVLYPLSPTPHGRDLIIVHKISSSLRERHTVAAEPVALSNPAKSIVYLSDSLLAGVMLLMTGIVDLG